MNIADLQGRRYTCLWRHGVNCRVVPASSHKRLPSGYMTEKAPTPKRGGFGVLYKDLLGGRCCRCVFLRKLATEALNTTRSINHLLLAGEERVTGSADFHVDVALVCRTRLELGPTGALYVDLAVGRMNTLFCHDLENLSAISLCYRAPRTEAMKVATEFDAARSISVQGWPVCHTGA